MVSACRRPLTPDFAADLRAGAAAVDWPQVHAIAVRHRVQGLVHDAIVRAKVAMPAEIEARLAAAARKIALRGLNHAFETCRLADLAGRAGLPIVVLKGAPLAWLAYGSVTIKHAIDIDLFVRPADLPAGRAVLSDAGYTALARAVDKDEPWWNAERTVRVELHSALSELPSRLDDIDPVLAIRQVPLCDGVTVPMLDDDHLIPYLCVHGAAHGWSRLKWLADIAALLASAAPTTIDRLLERSVDDTSGRCVAQAIDLCAYLFGTGVPGARAIRRGPVDRWLAANARRSFRGANETDELDARPFSTIRIHLAQLVLTAGWRDRAMLLRRKLVAVWRGALWRRFRKGAR